MFVSLMMSAALLVPAPVHHGQVPGSSLEGIDQGVAILNARAAAEAAVATAQAAAIEAAKPKPKPKPQVQAVSHTGVNWDGIARCETGGNWHMQGSTFSGGVGFANTTWNGFGGREFAPNAGQATREQQIIVAERVYARYGLSGWGCRKAG